MYSILEFLYHPYSQYSPLYILLEATAVFLGLVSVWCSKNNNIFVYPTGMISTSIYVFLLFKFDLIGDMLINGYYFLMSIYGWYFWTQSKNGIILNKISRMNILDLKASLALFISAILFVFIIYYYFNMWNNIIAYFDTITTAIFFVGMWLMARRKIENWLFWIIGNVISVPIYLYKGLALTSFQYMVFTFIAIAGYVAWEKEIKYVK